MVGSQGDEIYRAIPIRRVLVKANSEGRRPRRLRPHPRRRRQHVAAGSRRTAAWGWRAFVIPTPTGSRAKPAYSEFSRSTAVRRKSWSRSERARSTSSRANRSTRCSGRCRAPAELECRSPRNNWAGHQPRYSAPCSRKCSQGHACRDAGRRCGSGRRQCEGHRLPGIAGVANVDTRATGPDRRSTRQLVAFGRWRGSGLPPRIAARGGADFRARPAGGRSDRGMMMRSREAV